MPDRMGMMRLPFVGAALALLAGASSALAQSSPPAAAPEASASSRFGLGIDIGYASLRRSFSVAGSTTDDTLAMAFRGEFEVAPRLLLGLEIGGCTIESSNAWDPAKGEAIETDLLTARYFPAVDSGLFVKGGIGFARYWTNHPGENGANGSGAVIGVGYDRRLGNSRFHVTQSLDYSWGAFDGVVSPPGVTQDQRYRAVSIRVGIAYYGQYP